MRRPAEAILGDALRRRGMTVAVAESCTGGWLGARLTSIPGSSDYFMGGVIAYSNQSKVRDLGVKPADLQRWGAVSAPVARQMAAGVRRRFRTDIGLAVTGVAGPGGGTARKPVGLVFVAADWNGGRRVCRCRFGGSRETVRRRAVTQALRMLRGALTSAEKRALIAGRTKRRGAVGAGGNRGGRPSGESR